MSINMTSVYVSLQLAAKRAFSRDDVIKIARKNARHAKKRLSDKKSQPGWR